MATDILANLGIAEDGLLRRGLRRYEEAGSLLLAEEASDGREHRLTSDAAACWVAMKHQARDQGVEIFIVSAFRSVERQAEIIRRKLALGQTIDEILQVCAPPGFSEHHTGRAVDVGTPGVPALATEFAETPAFKWLRDHAGDFDYRLSYPPGNPMGYQYEPWHWCHRSAA